MTQDRGVRLVESRPLPGRTPASGDGGAITALSTGAARVGAGILAAGGNAADAAVAAALAAGVTEPAMNGLGGTAYVLIFDPASGRTTALEGSARCGEAAHEDMFEPLDGVGGGLYGFPPTEGDRAETGALAALPPTAPSVLFEVHRRFGRLPFGVVAEPAIRLAADGFAPEWPLVLHIAAGYRRLSQCPDALALYTRDGSVPFSPTSEDDRLRIPDLAAALELLATEGPEPFTSGRVARQIVEAVQGAGGILSEADLAQATVREVAPLRFGFGGSVIETLPANSGGPTLAATLAHLDAFPEVATRRDSLEDRVRFLHLAAEAQRLAFGDRFRHLGDPEHDEIPLDGLLDPDYLAERRRGVTADGPRFDDPEAPPPAGAAGDCTTHLNAMDADGMAVALTATLGGRFGSAFAAPGLGYPLNNGMMWFDPRPGTRISPAPGRRALHAGAPALVFEADAATPRAAAGAAGGRRLISATVMTLARLRQGRSIQDAAGGPGLHDDGGGLFLDQRTPECEQVAEALEGRGHDVLVSHETPLTGHFGRANGIVRTAEAGSPRSGPRFKPRFETGVDPVRAATGICLAETPPKPPTD